MADERKAIVIPDEPVTDGGKNSENYKVYPPEYEGHLEKVLLSRDVILKRVQVLARKIHEDYAGTRPVFVCVLKGANPFYQDLLLALQDLRQGFTTEFLRATSYEGTSSTGNVVLGGGMNYRHLNGKHVILVEDIIDTGTTLSQALPKLSALCSPKSIEVCAFLEKRLDEPPKINAKYVGYSVPNFWLVGYGLDLNQVYRDVKDIWILKSAAIGFDASTLYSTTPDCCEEEES